MNSSYLNIIFWTGVNKEFNQLMDKIYENQGSNKKIKSSGTTKKRMQGINYRFSRSQNQFFLAGENG